MKLLIAADIFPPESGGPATYSVTLANELVKLGDTVTIVSLNPHSDKNVLGTKVHLFTVTSRFKPLRYWQYYKLLLKHGATADVIYAMGPVNAGWPALRAARKLGKKFVVKVVGDYAWEQGRVKGMIRDSIEQFQTKMYRGKIGLLQKIEKQVVRKADGVFTPSNYLRKLVIGWGANPEKVIVVFNAVELPGAVSVLSKPMDERWVVTVARLTPWKGVRSLIEAVTGLQTEYPNLKLKIVGSGPELPFLQTLVGQKNAADMVEFLGNLPRQKALSYTQAADVFVLNSDYEGLSHVILEAQALGVPVLASNVGGNPEIVGKNGLFTFDAVEEIKNKIRSILAGDGQNSDAKELMYKNQGVEKMVHDTHSVLQSLCAN